MVDGEVTQFLWVVLGKELYLRKGRDAVKALAWESGRWEVLQRDGARFKPLCVCLLGKLEHSGGSTVSSEVSLSLLSGS